MGRGTQEANTVPWTFSGTAVRSSERVQRAFRKSQNFVMKALVRTTKSKTQFLAMFRKLDRDGDLTISRARAPSASRRKKTDRRESVGGASLCASRRWSSVGNIHARRVDQILEYNTRRRLSSVTLRSSGRSSLSRSRKSAFAT